MKLACEFCSYYWRESRYDAETGETIWLEDRASCHFQEHEIWGPAPCEEEDF